MRRQQRPRFTTHADMPWCGCTLVVELENIRHLFDVEPQSLSIYNFPWACVPITEQGHPVLIELDRIILVFAISQQVETFSYYMWLQLLFMLEWTWLIFVLDLAKVLLGLRNTYLMNVCHKWLCLILVLEHAFQELFLEVEGFEIHFRSFTAYRSEAILFHLSSIEVFLGGLN